MQRYIICIGFYSSWCDNGGYTIENKLDLFRSTQLAKSNVPLILLLLQQRRML
jgi:hypothetical protein